MKGTDIRMKKTTSLGCRLISSFISCVMVATLVSAPGIAYAVDQIEGKAQETTEQPEVDVEADAPERIYDSVELEGAEDASANTSSDASEQPKAPSGAVAPETADAASSVEMLSAKVELGESVQAAIAYNNMSFIVTDETAKTASLVGLSAAANLSGELQIPSQVTSGANTYTLTAIEMCAGGVSAKPDLGKRPRS